MLTIGEHILLFLAEVWDLLDAIPSQRQIMISLQNLGNTMPYKRSSLASALHRKLQTGEIERVEKNGKVYFRLTTQGRGRLARDFPLARFGGEKWDGRWRVVIFDIPEENKVVREEVREKLKELGFGMLQKSVWLTPFKLEEDLTNFLAAKRLSPYVLVMVVKELWVDDEQELASKIWKLDRLGKLYEELVWEWGKMTREFEEKGDKEKLRMAAFDWEREFLSLLRTDPCLPPELTPTGWMGEEAREIYKKEACKLLH